MPTIQILKTEKLLMCLFLLAVLMVNRACIDSSIDKSQRLNDPNKHFISQLEWRVRHAMLSSKEAWNSRDANEFLAFFHEDAQIMVGYQQKIVSKSDYAHILPSLFRRLGKVRIDLSQVDMISLREAEVVATVSFSELPYVWFVQKIRICYFETSQNWLIERSAYDIYFRGMKDPREYPKDRGETLD